MNPINIVWLKRDLRLQDHAPLAEACRQSEPVLLLYILEPSLVDSRHYAPRHWRFVWQSLQDMRRNLEPHEIRLHAVHGEARSVFETLHQHVPLKQVFSHEETGVDLTFRRNIEMAEYFKSLGVRWREFPTNAVQRGLMHRNGWWRSWRKMMNQPLEAVDLGALQQARLPDACTPWL